MFCPQTGAPHNESKSRFCPGCGAPTQRQPQAIAATPTPAEVIEIRDTSPPPSALFVSGGRTQSHRVNPPPGGANERARIRSTAESARADSIQRTSQSQLKAGSSKDFSVQVGIYVANYRDKALGRTFIRSELWSTTSVQIPLRAVSSLDDFIDTHLLSEVHGIDELLAQGLPKHLAISMGKEGPVDLPKSIANVRTTRELLDSGHFSKRGNSYHLIVTFDRHIPSSENSETEEDPETPYSCPKPKPSEATGKAKKQAKRIKREPSSVKKVKEESLSMSLSTPLAVRRKREVSTTGFDADEEIAPYNLRSRGQPESEEE